MTTHRLKVDTAYVDHLLSGAKTFEVRRNDRAFMVGDYLLMQEDGDPRVSQDSYGREEGHWREPDDEVNRCSMCRSRRYVRARIAYVYSGDPRWSDLAHGYVVLGLDGVGLSLPIGGQS